MKNNKQTLELCLLILSVFLLHLVPQLHSNYFFGYDAFHETMQINEILIKEEISGMYIHPPLYVLPLAVLSIFSSISGILLIKYSMAVVVAFLGVAIYFLTKEITNNHRTALLAVIFLTLSTGLGSHFYFQFHLNFMEHRSLYIGWVFAIMSILFLIKYLNETKIKHLIFGGIFFSAAALSYYLVGGSLLVASVSIMIYHFFQSRRLSEIIKIGMIYFLVSALAMSIFVIPKLDYVKFVLGEMKEKIYFDHKPTSFFYYFALPGALSLIGILSSIKSKKQMLMAVWLIGLLIYFEVYFLRDYLPELFKVLISLPDRSLRECKVPMSILAAIGTSFIISKIPKKLIKLAVIIIILGVSMYNPMKGFLYQEPFTNTDIIPKSAVESMSMMPEGKVVSDDMTVAFVRSFSNKDVFGGLHEKAVGWNRELLGESKRIYEALQQSSDISPEIDEKLNQYGIKYLFINHYEHGKYKNNNLEENPRFDKVYDGDQATIFSLRPS